MGLFLPQFLLKSYGQKRSMRRPLPSPPNPVPDTPLLGRADVKGTCSMILDLITQFMTITRGERERKVGKLERSLSVERVLSR